MTQGLEAPDQVIKAVPQNMIMAFAGRVKDVAGNVFKERRPWTEMVDRTAFSRPANSAEVSGRLQKNLGYFKINYLIVLLATTGIVLCMHPSSLIILAFLGMAWTYLFIVRQAPIVIGGRTFSEREKFIGASIISCIVIFFLTNVGTVLFYALGIGAVAIATHGALRVPDDLFTDETVGGGGFFSFLGGGSSAAVTSNV